MKPIISVSIFLILQIVDARIQENPDANSKSSPTPKVKVQVYIESLCPDTSNFIHYQLTPTYHVLQNIIDLEFIIFGKAQYSVRTDAKGNTIYTFQCQHGPEECKMNQFMLCGQNALKGHNFTATVDFINCTMRRLLTDPATAACVLQSGLDFDDLKACAMGVEGLKMHAEDGRLTNALPVFPTFIPWVVVDGMRERWYVYDFKSAVCRAYKGQKPIQCSE